MNDINLLDTPTLQCQWIRSTFIEQVPQLVADGYTMIAYMVIAQGIETMGAFIDKKPFKARGQGAARFALALETPAQPTKYSSLSRQENELMGNFLALEPEQQEKMLAELTLQATAEARRQRKELF